MIGRLKRMKQEGRCYQDAKAHPASPRNSASDRLTLTIAASSRRPKEGLILSARNDMALSIITQDGTRSPLAGVGSTRTRSSGATSGSEVSSSTVRERTAPNTSDLITSAGRGLP